MGSDEPTPPPTSSESEDNSGSGEIKLREYQQEAVDAWFANDNRGIFAMATGTGKTYTAIGAVDQFLHSKTTPTLVIIAVPYTHLAPQWADSLSSWGYDRNWNLYGTANEAWRKDLSRLVSDLTIGVRDHAIVLTTHQTASQEDFRTTIERADCDKLIIADEVHGMGSEHHRTGLTDAYQYRLGLSATPTRHYDDEGTAFLNQYFDDTVYSYSLADAIPEYLTPYEYHPIIVELTEDELSDYQSLSSKIGAEWNKEIPDEERLTRLLNQRARIIKSANRKLNALRDILNLISDPDHLLVYTNSQQIDDVQRVLSDADIIHHKFTYQEDSEERAELLDGFERGAYDTLVAMKCLDEGIDVPATKQAILMSSSNNPKQFIQRRGRVLRRADDIGKEKAVIYDLVVVPTTNPHRELRDSERTILENELRRFLEFADTAMNNASAINKIQPVCTAYELNLSDLREETTNA
jgi:superfamily II DNA or RNA helicase